MTTPPTPPTPPNNLPPDDAHDLPGDDQQRQPKDAPAPDANANSDEGALGFILGPRDKPDGTPIEWTPDDVRRFKALQLHLERLAKQHGLDVVGDIEPGDSPVADSKRSRDIAKAANPAMAKGAADVMLGRRTRTIKMPDGAEATETTTGLEIKSWGELGDALGKLITGPFKWSGRVSVKCGKWLKAKVSASSDAGEQD